MQPNYVCRELAGVLGAGECDAIVARAEALGFAPTGGDYPPSYRDNDRLVFDDEVLANALYEQVKSRLPAELDGGVLVGLNPRFRLCRYRNGQSFRIHRDGAYAPDAHRRSRLTLQISLSDPSAFDGGRTRFYETRRGGMVAAFRPARGAALLFDHEHWHDGEAVTHGTKIVFRTDAVYRFDTPRDAASSDAASRDIVTRHRGYVFALASLGDGRIASGARDRIVRVTNEHTGERSDFVGHEAAVSAIVEVTPRVLVTASRDHTVRRFDVDDASGESRVLLRGEGAFLSLARITDGAFVAGDATGAITFASVATGTNDTTRVTAHDGWVWAVAARGDVVVSGADDGTVSTWSASQRERRVRTTLGSPVHALAFAGDELVCACADGSVRRLEAATLRERARIDAHDGEIYALATSHDGTFATGGEDGAVRVWDAHGSLLATAKGDAFVRAIIVDREHRFVVGDYEGLVRGAFPRRPSVNVDSSRVPRAPSSTSP